jgi:hypothetical protein
MIGTRAHIEIVEQQRPRNKYPGRRVRWRTVPQRLFADNAVL